MKSPTTVWSFSAARTAQNKDGVIVGAVGVSGGSVAEDTNVAKAGVAAFK
ncbi:MAG: heme-binding protein [Bilophila wadsworthia]